MKSLPIIFSGEMVRAILDGRKTQTRRVARPQPTLAKMGDRWTWRHPRYKCVDTTSGLLADRMLPYCPYGVPGDQLWVRETWAVVENDKGNPTTQYRANIPESDWQLYGPWYPPDHMPRWASRITVEITGVRVEQLQKISEADAVAEGFDAT